MRYSFLKDLTVIYVEDDSDTRKQTSIAIEDFFKKFHVCKNATEALALDTKADVLITDIRMPNISGIELVKKMRQSTNQPDCIIFTTAHDDSEYLLQAISLKVDEYILKPVDLVELLDRISKNIRVKKQGKELEVNKKIIEALSIFVGGKKIEIIRHIMERSDSEGNYFGSYEELMEYVDVSKPTIVSTFKQLIDAGLLQRIKNRHYKLISKFTLNDN